jgi:hypothetical protein
MVAWGPCLSWLADDEWGSRVRQRLLLRWTIHVDVQLQKQSTIKTRRPFEDVWVFHFFPFNRHTHTCFVRLAMESCNLVLVVHVWRAPSDQLQQKQFQKPQDLEQQWQGSCNTAD